MIEIFTAVAAAIATIASGFIAYRGSKRTTDADALTKAAGLYSDYAEKMEERVAALEEDQKDLNLRLTEAERDAKKYKEDAIAYQKIIADVIQWLTEIIDWESRGFGDPQPHFTLAMVLAHLTKSRSAFEERSE